jgi:Na+/H+ antiporter NhaD/arsenite permease-like protein
MVLALQFVPALKDALRTTLPLAVFLAIVIWLARAAQRAGIAGRLARLLARSARGRAWTLYLLVCGLTAALTAAVSLDGAVVLMVPIVATLAHERPWLLRPLALGTIAVANTFSIALPEGNPTNLVVMARLHLSPGEFVRHLFVPGLVATAVCVVMVGVAERRILRTRLREFAVLEAQPPDSSTAGLTVPWRVLAQIAVLVTALGTFAGNVDPAVGHSLGWIVLLALGSGAIACLVNNLPASALLASLLGSPGIGAYAVMTGLSVGALATPHGSVATVIVRDGLPPAATAGFARLLIGVTLVATTVAAISLWLLN